MLRRTPATSDAGASSHTVLIGATGGLIALASIGTALLVLTGTSTVLPPTSSAPPPVGQLPTSTGVPARDVVVVPESAARQAERRRVAAGAALAARRVSAPGPVGLAGGAVLATQGLVARPFALPFVPAPPTGVSLEPASPVVLGVAALRRATGTDLARPLRPAKADKPVKADPGARDKDGKKSNKANKAKKAKKAKKASSAHQSAPLSRQDREDPEARSHRDEDAESRDERDDDERDDDDDERDD